MILADMFLLASVYYKFVLTGAEGLQLVPQPSSSNNRKLLKKSGRLSYSSEGVVVVPDNTCNRQQQQQEEENSPLDSLAKLVLKLNDPEVHFKVRRGIKRRCDQIQLKKEEVVDLANSNFQKGQQAAMNAISDVLALYGIDEEEILPKPKPIKAMILDLIPNSEPEPL